MSRTRAYLGWQLGASRAQEVPCKKQSAGTTTLLPNMRQGRPF